MSNPAAIILGAIQLIREATRAIEEIQGLLGDGTRDLSEDELNVLRARVNESYDKFQNLLRDRGID